MVGIFSYIGVNTNYSQSLSEKSSSGKSVLIQVVECGLVTIPLQQVNLQSDLVSCTETVGA